jgi:hypothetical protein
VRCWQTTYERCCAELIKEYDLDYANWRLVQEIELAGRKSGRAVSRGRRWPIGPDDFDELIKDKIFTNGTDAEVVKTLCAPRSCITPSWRTRALAARAFSAPSHVEPRVW